MMQSRKQNGKFKSDFLESEIKDALLEHFFRPRMFSGTSYITSDTNQMLNR